MSDTKNGEFEVVKDKKPMKNGQLVGAEDGQQSFYIQLDEERTYQVEAVAYYIWYKCDGTKTVSQIVEEVSKEAELEEQRMREPIALILKELQNASLVSM